MADIEDQSSRDDMTNQGDDFKRYILVVDDDPDIRWALQELLTEAGYDVVCQSSGQSALTFMCGSTVTPALVLMDVLMPGMNAWELIGEMKRRQRLASVPVVATTGSGPGWPSPVPDEMLLRKPIDRERLFALVDRFVDGGAKLGMTAAGRDDAEPRNPGDAGPVRAR